TEGLQSGDVVHVVEPGDSLARLAATYLGDSNGWPQIYDDNRDRPQPDGSSLQEAGKISPGWILVIRHSIQPVDYDDAGQAWHTVRQGESLWEVARATLGDGRQWSDIFASNQGARMDDGHALTDPNLIWPGLRLRMPALDRTVPNSEPAPPADIAV